jgi:hypothetical protein
LSGRQFAIASEVLWAEIRINHLGDAFAVCGALQAELGSAEDFGPSISAFDIGFEVLHHCSFAV